MRGLTLARYPDRNLEDASTLAQKERVLIHEGTDPPAERRKEKLALFRAKSFEELAADYMVRAAPAPAGMRAIPQGYTASICRAHISRQVSIPSLTRTHVRRPDDGDTWGRRADETGRCPSKWVGVLLLPVCVAVYASEGGDWFKSHVNIVVRKIWIKRKRMNQQLLLGSASYTQGSV